MRAVIQRVIRAEVVIDGKPVATIGPGILTLLGVATGDSEKELTKLVEKICRLRIFEDENGKMNRSLIETQGEHLIVSQFTLLGDCSSGRRPSFTGAAPPDSARALFDRALEISRELQVPTQGGVFQANMQVSLVNDGPVTFVLDEKNVREESL
ncbi:MAG: D-tyrosyl-tRNA(Tyr) deacylase [Bdellovibrionales bacterium GWB1_55_8]|nr:MAG: D-tyrosyl-tRNA(Tyr) deacylase [Bdellovibrionales bacterium GWB1_55_8]